MSSELSKRDKGAGMLATFDMPVEALAQHFVKSGYFANVKDVSHAIVKIQFGKELGIPPMASMSGIHVVEGKPTLGSNLLATTVQRSGKYRYKVLALTNDRCEIEFLAGGESLGKSSFTIQDATKAGLAGKFNWKNYPRNMLFARAMSNGVRWYCPEVTGGPIYTVEEMQDAGKFPIEPNPDEPKSRSVANTARDGNAALDDFNREIEGKSADTSREAGRDDSPAGESAPAGRDIIDAPGAMTEAEVVEWEEGTAQVAMTHGWTEAELKTLVAAGLKRKGFDSLAASTAEFRDKVIANLRDDDQKKKRDERRAAAASK